MVNLNRVDRRLKILFGLLLPLLVSVHWAAENYPVASHEIWSEVEWLDDRFAILKHQYVRYSVGRASQSRFRYFLLDCHRNSLVNLRGAVQIPGSCANWDRGQFLLDGSVLITRNTVQDEFYLWKLRLDSVDSGQMFANLDLDGSLVGRRYWLQPNDRRIAIFDLIEQNWLDEVALESGFDNLHCSEDISSFLVSYEMPIEANTAESQRIRDSIVGESTRLGIPSDGLRLIVHYCITDGKVKEVLRWLACEQGKLSAGLIATLGTSRNEIEIRNGSTGSLEQCVPLRSISNSGAGFDWRFEQGAIRYFNTNTRAFINIDGISGQYLPTEDSLRGEIVTHNSKYLVGLADVNTKLRENWPLRTQVRDIADGRLLHEELPVRNWVNVAFTADGDSLKIVDDQDRVYFFHIPSGNCTVVSPRSTNTLICYCIAVLAGIWCVLWVFECHRQQLPIWLQANVLMALFSVMVYWRLSLSGHPWRFDRVAWFTADAIILGGGLWWLSQVLKVARKKHWSCGFTLGLLIIYGWYLVLYFPSSPYDREKWTFLLLTIIGVWGIVEVLKRLPHLISRHPQFSSVPRFSILTLLFACAHLAVFTHQITIIDWQPILATGFKGFTYAPIPRIAIETSCVILVGMAIILLYRRPMVCITMLAGCFVCCVVVSTLLRSMGEIGYYDELFWDRLGPVAVRWIVFFCVLVFSFFNLNAVRSETRPHQRITYPQ